MPLPDLPFLASEPDLPDHLHFERRAFDDLSRDRDVGFGVGPIAWSSIDAYARRYEIDELDAFERFAELIMAMDRAFLDHQAEKHKQQQQQKPNAVNQ